MSSKNVTASSFSTFVSVLREEEKLGFFLLKFDYKNGYFCGSLSDDKAVNSEYKKALAAIDEESKELQLQKIMTLLPQRLGYEGPLTEQHIEQIKQLSPVSDLPESQITRLLWDVVEETLKQEQKDGDSATGVAENEFSPSIAATVDPEPTIEKQAVKQRVSRRTKK